MRLLQAMSKTDRERAGSGNEHLTKIAVSASFVVGPMVAFTVAILAIIFSKVIDLDYCPQSELCPHDKGPKLTNGADYYVNFSVCRVAFVSSLSSTFSFALVAAMMTVYGYVIAGQLLQASSSTSSRKSIPLTPHGISTLIRLLDTKMLLMWDMLVSSCRAILRMQGPVGHWRRTRVPRMLR